MASYKAAPGSQGGAIFLFVLALVAIAGVGMAAFGRSWSHDARRDREQRLLDAGDAYRNAIGSYHAATPGAIRQYPPDLASLLTDPRFPDVRRHLRQPIDDPMTGKNDWVLIPAPGGGIAGVASPSGDRPLKVSGFAGANRAFEALSVARGERMRYRDWEFIYTPESASNLRDGNLQSRNEMTR